MHDATSVFDNFYRLTTLNFYIEEPNDSQQYVSSVIYGNGRHQTKVIINVEIIDKNNNPLPLSAEILYPLIYFCDEQGNKLTDDWVFRDHDNGFYEMLSFPHNESIMRKEGNSLSTKSTTSVSKFISCVNDISSDVFVGIDIPGIGKFNTTAKGTYTPNCPHGEDGKPFVCLSVILINSLPTISYSCKEYLTFVNVSEEDHGDFGWTSRLGSLGPYKQHTKNNGDNDYGIIKKIILRISPIEELGEKNYFKKCGFQKNNIDWNTISKKTIKWSTVDHKYESCFKMTLIKDENITASNISGLSSNDSYQLNVWYLKDKDNHIIGSDFCFYLEQPNYYNRCCPFIRDEINTVPGEMVVYKFILKALANCTAYGWNDKYNGEGNKQLYYTLYLTDRFGNNGIINLIFNKDSFDRPSFEWFRPPRYRQVK